MTDEELAKYWVISKSGYSIEEFHGKKAMQAFLAGLKAGRPKWHKITDGDLPQEQKEYWCKVFFYESEETFNAFLWFDTVAKNFKLLEEIEEHVESSFKVKEWCEISEFEE